MAVKTKKQTKTQSKNGRTAAATTADIQTRLNALLADEHLLYVKSRDYHWNVEGVHFVALHELFERHYETLALREDVIAEQIRKLEGKAIGTMEAFLDKSRLSEKPGQKFIMA